MNKNILLGGALLLALLGLSVWMTGRSTGGRAGYGSAGTAADAGPSVIPAPPRPLRTEVTETTEEAKAPSAPAADGNGRITGVVFRKKDKSPVPGVRVRARDRTRRDRGAGPGGPSDPGVVVEITGPPDGGPPPNRGWRRGPGGTEPSPADPLPPAPAPAPAPAASSSAASPTAPPPPPQAVSAADGRFTLTLAAGTWELDVDDPDNLWSVSRAARNNLRRIELAAGETKAVEVPVYRNRRMTGKITAAGGEKIPPKTININLRGSRGRDRSDVDDEGNFTLRIEDEDNDRFRLEVSADGYGKVVRDVAWPIEEDLADQDVVLGNGTTLRGRVQDPEGRPIPKIRIEMINATGPRPQWDRLARAESGAGGEFEIRGVPPGNHLLIAGDRTWKQAEGPLGIAVPDEPVYAAPPLVLVPRGKFRGRIIGPDGRPGPAVLWFPTGARRGAAKDGTFEIDEPDPGWSALFGVEGSTLAELKLSGDGFKTLMAYFTSPADAVARFHEIQLIPGTREEAAEIVAQRRYEGEREGRWWDVRSTVGIPDATAAELRPMFDEYFRQYYPLLDRFGAANDDAARLVVQREIDGHREVLFQQMRPRLTVEQGDALRQLFEQYRRSGWPNGVPAELGR